MQLWHLKMFLQPYYFHKEWGYFYSWFSLMCWKELKGFLLTLTSPHGKIYYLNYTSVAWVMWPAQNPVWRFMSLILYLVKSYVESWNWQTQFITDNSWYKQVAEIQSVCSREGLQFTIFSLDSINRGGLIEILASNSPHLKITFLLRVSKMWKNWRTPRPAHVLWMYKGSISSENRI